MLSFGFGFCVGFFGLGFGLGFAFGLVLVLAFGFSFSFRLVYAFREVGLVEQLKSCATRACHSETPSSLRILGVTWANRQAGALATTEGWYLFWAGVGFVLFFVFVFLVFLLLGVLFCFMLWFWFALFSFFCVDCREERVLAFDCRGGLKSCSKRVSDNGKRGRLC